MIWRKWHVEFDHLSHLPSIAASQGQRRAFRRHLSQRHEVRLWGNGRGSSSRPTVADIRSLIDSDLQTRNLTWIPKIPMFKMSHLFQTIFLGIDVSFRWGVVIRSSWGMVDFWKLQKRKPLRSWNLIWRHQIAKFQLEISLPKPTPCYAFVQFLGILGSTTSTVLAASFQWKYWWKPRLRLLAFVYKLVVKWFIY